MKRPYQILRISPTASSEEIRLAYRRRAYETHPDRPTGSHQAFIEVQAAYRALTDTVLFAQCSGDVTKAFYVSRVEEQRRAQLKRRRARLARLRS